ncbi:demethylmenaquinone methyltransferase [Timonella senegalensis]|uniref:demethylmenaquinone methyltransferase n=1 Tax=Timonella senegalensis TaxID=1465825 RepID=UPI0028AECD92|nr:demethylmenaquinone methyltransferase [Timonella senegalensis]
MSRASLDKKPQDVASMFDGIASKYDITNDVISLGQDRAWRRATVAAVNPQPGDRILDLAAGTGTSSEPFDAAGALVVPCDFSFGMLKVGKVRRPDLPFTAGDATQLPFADNSFNAATISFGLRNVVDTVGALSELFRVVKPGGHVVICEFSTPTWKPFRTVYSNYLMKALPKVAGLVTRDSGSYDYLAESISQWPNQEGLAELMQEAGWRNVAYRNLTGGIVALHRATKPLV